MLVTVGTGTVAPWSARSSPAHWVEADGRAASSRSPRGPSVRLLMDCGAGTCNRLARFGLPWADVTHLALTHFHADHYGELPTLIFAMKYGTMTPRTAPLALLGPAGTREKLERLAAAFGEWVTEPGFPLAVTEIAPGSPVELAPEVTLDAHRTPHTEESLALRVSTPAGRLVYTGDTGPSDDLAVWAAGCDLLLAECSLPEPLALDFHLTPRQAGAMAARAKAGRLVLTHFYPPVEEVDVVAEAAREYRGPITKANDGDKFEVGR